MSNCKDCPHDTGRIFEVDCQYPDCMGGYDSIIQQQQAKISELQAVIDEIMEIAHLGGLRNVDNEDALIAIRHLTKSRFEEIKGAWTSSHRTVDDQ